ncbi:hypothetical protein SAMN05443637_104216 [Pseudonocardia thermophila]|uniref:Molecular chaperone DnaJ n=1 Tax=Pseudonocardia thermophila TaxID=1848 RepID=A0A1M6R7D3_PSETH|nr:hypothetical protein [Pseudonocardia thermophila]SHK28248.1 hypothetical protein SAMN05443637_104216 [Pseudonocardia thermophila]
MFRRNDRPSPAPDEAAFAARNAATQGFLALDDEQRAAAEAVRVADEIAGEPRLRAQWEQVSAQCDRATEAYLAATQQYPLDGSAPVTGSKEADEKALREIQAARQAITRFRAQHAREIDEADMLIRNLPQAIQKARVALVDADKAITQAERAGYPSRRATEMLVEAVRAETGIDSAAGLRDRHAAAQRTIELARAAAKLAEEAPKTAASVQSALRSVRTRREAALTKIEGIEPALSALRREFSEPCSRDLVDAEKVARAAVAEATAALDEAERFAGTGEWDDAADAVARARGELGRAEERVKATTDRLTHLREVKADPSKEAADTRFVLRDAQRLVVDRGLVDRFGPILDAQAVRLENAQARLTGVHPDYWFYLTELRGIRERVRAVVDEVRGLQRR